MANYDPMEAAYSGNPTIWGQFVWFQQFGYVRIRDIARIVAIVYVILVAVVTVLTSDIVTLVFLGVLAIFPLKYTSINRYIPEQRRVAVYTDRELFTAEHLGSRSIRHGETPQQALDNLGLFSDGSERT